MWDKPIISLADHEVLVRCLSHQALQHSGKLDRPAAEVDGLADVEVSDLSIPRLHVDRSVARASNGGDEPSIQASSSWRAISSCARGPMASSGSPYVRFFSPPPETLPLSATSSGERARADERRRGAVRAIARRLLLPRGERPQRRLPQADAAVVRRHCTVRPDGAEGAEPTLPASFDLR